MKQTMLIAIASIFILPAFGLSCMKSGLRNLEYEDVGIHEWVQASVKKKGGDRVMWFQVFDNVDDSSIKDSYKNSSETFEKYPAKIYADKWIWILVNDRIEIRLIADDASEDYKNTEKLKEFLRAFDLGGMEKVTGPKVAAKDLEKFIPQLGSK